MELVGERVLDLVRELAPVVARVASAVSRIVVVVGDAQVAAEVGAAEAEAASDRDLLRRQLERRSAAPSGLAPALDEREQLVGDDARPGCGPS